MKKKAKVRQLNPYVVAVSEWLKRTEVKLRMEGSAEGVYLRNRLQHSFQDGWNAAQEHFERVIQNAVSKVGKP